MKPFGKQHQQPCKEYLTRKENPNLEQLEGFGKVAVSEANAMMRASAEKCPQHSFRPHASRVPLRCDIPSDEDIWVERSYRSRTGHKIFFYCSVKTGKFQLHEPPTGAGLVIHQQELAEQPAALQAFAKQPIPPDIMRDIKPCKISLNTKAHRRTWRKKNPFC